MKLFLATHANAPELNKAVVYNPKTKLPVKTFSVPGIVTIKGARACLFAPLKRTGRFVTMKASNVPGLAVYDRTKSGFCNDVVQLAAAIHNMKQRHNLPGCKIEIRTKLVG